MKQNILKLTSIFLLVLGISFSSCQKEEKTETFGPSYGEAMADFEAVPRRCRVIKRYRPKGEIYRILVDVPNNSNMSNAFAEIIFDKKEGEAPLSSETIILNTVKSQGKNGKDIEMQSEEFESKANSENQTYTFTLKLYDNDKNFLGSQRYSVTFGENSKKPQTNFAILLSGDTETKSIEIGVEKEGDKLPTSGFFNLAIGIEGDNSKEVDFIQVSLTNIKGIEVSPAKVALKFTSKKDGVRFFSNANEMFFKGNLEEGVFDVEVSMFNKDGKEIEGTRSSLTSVQAPYF